MRSLETAITITAAGTRRLRRLDQAVVEVQDKLLAPLSRRERQTLVRMLTRVLERHSAFGLPFHARAGSGSVSGTGCGSSTGCCSSPRVLVARSPIPAAARMKMLAP